MFKKWKERRKVQKDWEGTIMSLTEGIANAPLDQKSLGLLGSMLRKTMLLYRDDNRMTKKTLRLLFHLKRILMDKRALDFMKVIEYIIAADGVARKSLGKEIKQRIMAHYLQMASLYDLIAIRQQKSNPFAPGEMLQEGEGNE